MQRHIVVKAPEFSFLFDQFNIAEIHFEVNFLSNVCICSHLKNRLKQPSLSSIPRIFDCYEEGFHTVFV